MVKVSIIMPVYNSEKYLKHAVESVLSQDFDDFELILVDDG
ncbi:MAG: glycosyltransferase family 2 protein, partial [Bacillota bacterium]